MSGGHRRATIIGMSVEQIAPLRVVVAGGGVAALEAVMALHDLGGRRLQLTLVAPHEDYVLRAMSVAVPFGDDGVQRVALDDVCADVGAEHRRAAVVTVDAAARRVSCSDGTELDYDVLVLATGAVAGVAFAHALTFSDEDPVLLGGLLRDVEHGACRSLAVVVPPSGSWALPVYELALLIARHARRVAVDIPMHLVTPEPAALQIFGPPATAAVTRLLADAGITLHAGSYASVERRGRIVLRPGDRRLTVDRVVALPTINGRPIAGVPADEHGFVPVDGPGRVKGCDGAYAVGDGADFPVKQGGLAAQQADAAARHIAFGAGAPVVPTPFRPILRGMLLTGGEPQWLRSAPAGGGGEARVAHEALWWPPAKVAGDYLAPWLAEHAHVDHPPEGDRAVAVDVSLPFERDARPLSLDPLGRGARSSSPASIDRKRSTSTRSRRRPRGQ